jgi:hypothetical protein
MLITQLLLTGGCGYRNMLSAPTPDGAGDAGDKARRPTRVAVIALRNDSPEPWLDRILTDSMRREISARGDFDFVNDPRRADLAIRGRIRPLDVTSKSFSRFVAALEYGLTLKLDLEIVRARGDIVRLDPRMLTESDVYLASADIEVTRSNRLEVLRRLSDLLASRVADSLELIEDPIPDANAEGGLGGRRRSSSAALARGGAGSSQR